MEKLIVGVHNWGFGCVGGVQTTPLLAARCIKNSTKEWERPLGQTGFWVEDRSLDKKSKTTETVPALASIYRCLLINSGQIFG